MVTKGVITSINYNSNTCTVRMPLFENSNTTTEVSAPAIFACQPGTANSYKVDDVVLVTFEDELLNNPIVIGKLYLGANSELADARGAINCENLKVVGSAELPLTTKLGFDGLTEGIVQVDQSFASYKTIADIITALQNQATNASIQNNIVDGKISEKVSKVQDNKVTGFGWVLDDHSWSLQSYNSSNPVHKMIEVLRVDNSGVSLGGNVRIVGWPKKIEEFYIVAAKTEGQPAEDDPRWVQTIEESTAGKNVWKKLSTTTAEYNPETGLIEDVTVSVITLLEASSTNPDYVKIYYALVEPGKVPDEHTEWKEQPEGREYPRQENWYWWQKERTYLVDDAGHIIEGQYTETIPVYSESLNNAYVTAKGRSKTFYQVDPPKYPPHEVRAGDNWFCTKYTPVDLALLKTTRDYIGRYIAQGGKTVYFTNNKFWSNVKVYAWNETGGSWGQYPGQTMPFIEKNTYGENIHGIVIPKQYTWIIINNGQDPGWKTREININEIYLDGNNAVVISDNSNPANVKFWRHGNGQMKNDDYLLIDNKNFDIAGITPGVTQAYGYGELYQCTGFTSGGDDTGSKGDPIWENIGGELVANKLTANYIEALDIETRKLKVVDPNAPSTGYEDDKWVLWADGTKPAGSEGWWAKIGGFWAERNKLFNPGLNHDADPGDPDTLMLSTGTQLIGKSIGGFAINSNFDYKKDWPHWAFTVGNTLGIDKGGNMYVSNAEVQGRVKTDEFFSKTVSSKMIMLIDPNENEDTATAGNTTSPVILNSHGLSTKDVRIDKDSVNIGPVTIKSHGIYINQDYYNIIDDQTNLRLYFGGTKGGTGVRKVNLSGNVWVSQDTWLWRQFTIQVTSDVNTWIEVPVYFKWRAWNWGWRNFEEKILLQFEGTKTGKTLTKNIGYNMLFPTGANYEISFDGENWSKTPTDVRYESVESSTVKGQGELKLQGHFVPMSVSYEYDLGDSQHRWGAIWNTHQYQYGIEIGTIDDGWINHQYFAKLKESGLNGKILMYNDSGSKTIEINAKTGKGTASNGWVKGSDRRLKKDIIKLDNNFNDFYNDLKPVSYKLKDNTDGDAVHFGFIAQDIEKSVVKAGFEKNAFGLIKKPETEAKGQNFYALDYEEFIALNVYQIQQLKKQVAELAEKYNNLEEQIKK